MTTLDVVREQLLEILAGQGARLPFEAAVAGLPASAATCLALAGAGVGAGASVTA